MDGRMQIKIDCLGAMLYGASFLGARACMESAVPKGTTVTNGVIIKVSDTGSDLPRSTRTKPIQVELSKL
jgi:hypothetical protein